MKSLNKKISSILLAGMVVMGGVLSSGVSSFAASAKNVSVQNNYQRKRVENICKDYGRIIGESKYEKDFEKYYDKGRFYNNRKSVEVRNPYEIPKYLYNAKCRKYEFVKIKFYGLYYLIELN